MIPILNQGFVLVLSVEFNKLSTLRPNWIRLCQSSLERFEGFLRQPCLEHSLCQFGLGFNILKYRF